jgi:hypothetical protein
MKNSKLPTSIKFTPAIKKMIQDFKQESNRTQSNAIEVLLKYGLAAHRMINQGIIKFEVFKKYI